MNNMDYVAIGIGVGMIIGAIVMSAYTRLKYGLLISFAKSCYNERRARQKLEEKS